jgi:hypothetical protein
VFQAVCSWNILSSRLYRECIPIVCGVCLFHLYLYEANGTTDGKQCVNDLSEPLMAARTKGENEECIYFATSDDSSHPTCHTPPRFSPSSLLLDSHPMVHIPPRFSLILSST